MLWASWARRSPPGDGLVEDASQPVGRRRPRRLVSPRATALDEVGGQRIVALHLHDTYGRGLANVVAGLEAGVTTFDAAAGGLGGCPYARGASGNLATDNLLEVTALRRNGEPVSATHTFSYEPPVRARQISDEADLITGPLAHSRLGDWLLASTRFL